MRPYLIGTTLLVLAFAWYQKLKPQKEIECDCEIDEKPSFSQSRLFLGIVTGFALIMLAFPFYSSIFYPQNNTKVILADTQNIQEVDVNIKGMTCESCNLHVEHMVFELPGILSAKANFKTGKAVVKFDKSQVNTDSIMKAINRTGYSVEGFTIK